MIKLKKIKPLFTRILVTMDMYTEDVAVNGIIRHKSGEVKEIQKVISVGDSVRNVQEDDLVCIDPKRYEVKKYREDTLKGDLMTNQVIGYNIPQVEIDGKMCMLLDSGDIKYVVEKYEDIPDSKIISTQKEIII